MHHAAAGIEQSTAQTYWYYTTSKAQLKKQMEGMENGRGKGGEVERREEGEDERVNDLSCGWW